MFEWIKLIFEDKETKEEITSSLPEKSIGTVMPIRFLEYLPVETCKIHKNYCGFIPPTNNCNGCWEYYSKKFKH